MRFRPLALPASVKEQGIGYILICMRDLRYQLTFSLTSAHFQDKLYSVSDTNLQPTLFSTQTINCERCIHLFNSGAKLLVLKHFIWVHTPLA